MPSDPTLISAIDSVPAGAYAVGVSGGADSVALLSLLHARHDLQLTIAHLDHQLRGDASTADARFVADLAAKWQLPCVIARREEFELSLENPPTNPSAKYRAMRFAMFKRVVLEKNLRGVILAHHADDQAETILHRLLRGSTAAGLAGMSASTTLGGLPVLRPLLGVRHQTLVDFLHHASQPWREDASNQSDNYFRNRLRRLLVEHPQLSKTFADFATAMSAVRQWSQSSAPTLGETFTVGELANLPETLAKESARRWLIDRGVAVEAIDAKTLARLIEMASDAASPSRVDFPGDVSIMRKRGTISRQQA